MDEKTIDKHLGSERDPHLFPRLLHAVEATGGNILQVYSGIAGDHSIIVHEIAVGQEELILRSETGFGIVLSGPEAAVRQISELVAGRTTIW